MTHPRQCISAGPIKTLARRASGLPYTCAGRVNSPCAATLRRKGRKAALPLVGPWQRHPARTAVDWAIMVALSRSTRPKRHRDRQKEAASDPHSAMTLALPTFAWLVIFAATRRQRVDETRPGLTGLPHRVCWGCASQRR